MVRKSRKHILYQWTNGEQVLGYGVTDKEQLRSRFSEHVREEPGSRIKSMCLTATEADARKEGRTRLKNHERENGDLPPKNKPR